MYTKHRSIKVNLRFFVGAIIIQQKNCIIIQLTNIHGVTEIITCARFNNYSYMLLQKGADQYFLYIILDVVSKCLHDLVIVTARPYR